MMSVPDGIAQRFFACHVNSELIKINTVLTKYSIQRIYKPKKYLCENMQI